MAQTTRTFRIFVSSTFSDLKEERNALQKQVFPRLRELCNQHGCRFQAIDLRWGVRDEAGLDQQTMKICLDELSRSQRASPKPNFIVLLGDRYGWRPLPAEIPAREFKQIEHIETKTANANDRQLLDTWYKRDGNFRYKRNERAETEAVYCLQPRSDRFADFQVWENEVERPLREILLRGIEGLDLTEDERRKYEASATEQEIAAGALKVPDAKDHVFCFFRKIECLPEDESAKDFIDLDENGNLDSEAVARLKRLKGEEREGAQEVGLLETRLPGNIHRYNANWTGGGITTDHIGTLPESLEECLSLLEAGSASVPPARSGLCVDVWRRLARVILDEIARLERTEPLEREIADHVAFAEDRARLFVGRSSMLDTIADYLADSERHPLGVWGESGSGKSALMAKSIANCGWRNANCAVVSRFIGATPASSDGRSLLESVCRQVARIYGGDEATTPSDYGELVKEFGERLKLSTAEKPLIVFLDALDQLSDADHARNLIWLPAELPEHVRIVVSTLPGECKTALERKVPLGLVKLEPMPREEADELLEAWLIEAGRTLQPPQRSEVLSKFSLSAMTSGEGSGAGQKEQGMPLYLKLAFEEARRWKSYTPAVDLAPDIPRVIRQLLDRLSSNANHGGTIVPRSLGYLAAAKNGLSEDEMLDLLSLDDDVRADFKARAKHTPPEERLPMVIWSRLYFDLEPYLTERHADGASLLSFYHRQFREVVEAGFLFGHNRPARHAHIADYFAQQELFERKKKTPNVRKLSELPYQQAYGEKWDDLYATLTDFEFLEAKLTHVAVITSGKGESAKTIYGGVYELQEDYRRALEVFPASGWPERAAVISDSNQTRREELQDWRGFVMAETHVLGRFPEMVWQQAANTQRESAVSRHADAMQSAGRWQSRPWLRLINRPKSASACRMTLAHDCRIAALAVSPDGKTLATAEYDSPRAIRVWEIGTGRELYRAHAAHTVYAMAYLPDEQRIVTADGRGIVIWDAKLAHKLIEFRIPEEEWPHCYIERMAISPDGKSIAASFTTNVSPSSELPILVWRIESGLQWQQLSGNTSCVPGLAYTPDGRRLVSGGRDGIVKVWEAGSGSLEQTLEARRAPEPPPSPNAGQFVWSAWNSRQAPWEVRSLAVTPDGRRLVALGDELAVWDLETGDRTLAREQEGQPRFTCDIAFLPDGQRFAAVEGLDVVVRDLESGQALCRLSEHRGAIKAVRVLDSGSRLVSCSDDATVKIWNIEEGHGGEEPRLGGVKSLLLSPGGRWLEADGIVLDCETGEPAPRGDLRHTPLGYSMFEAITPDRRRGITLETLPGPPYGKGHAFFISVWDLKQNRLLHRLPIGIRISRKLLAMTPDGRRIVSVANNLTVWDADRGTELRHLEFQGLGWPVAITPDGREIFWAFQDGDLIFLDLDSLAVKRHFHHGGRLTTAAITPDGRRVVSVGQDGEIAVRDVRSGALVARYVEKADFVAFAVDDTIIALGGKHGLLLILELRQAAIGARIVPVLEDGGRIFFRCPYCETESQTPAGESPSENHCPQCNRDLKLVWPEPVSQPELVSPMLKRESWWRWWRRTRN